MKNAMDFCVNECPYYHDVVACMGGQVCPLKKRKKAKVKHIFFTFSYTVGCLFRTTPLFQFIVCHL